MSSAYGIAFKARLYRLLSERPEYLMVDRGEVVERLLDVQVALGEFDRTLILHASEIDRLCGHAVRAFAQRAYAPVLDVLGVLDPDRLAAMYFALPASRRESLRRDVAWAYHLDRMPPETEQVVAEVQGWALDSQSAGAGRARLTGVAPTDARTAMQRYERLALRHEVGLPVTLSEQEREVIAQADDEAARVRRVLDAFTDELAQVGETPDDETFASACERAVQRCA